MPEEEQKIKLTPQLKEIESTIKELSMFRDEELKKFKVGLLLNRSSDKLKGTISSFEQFLIRGEKVNSIKRNNIRCMRQILLDLLELRDILGIGSRYGVSPLKKQLEEKIKDKKITFKMPPRVIKEEKISD